MWHLAVGRQLAPRGGNEPRFPRRVAALPAWLPHRVPARIETGDRPGQRSSVRRGALPRLPHSGAADGGPARSLPLDGGVPAAEWTRWGETALAFTSPNVDAYPESQTSPCR